MKVAAAAAAAGVPVLYYITPQVWAWGAGRLARLARDGHEGGGDSAVRGDAAPRHGIDATFVGHPLLDRVDELPDRATARRALGLAATTACSRSFRAAARRRSSGISTRSSATARELQRRDPVARGHRQRGAARARSIRRDVRSRWCGRRRSRFCAPPTPRSARAARRRSRPRSPAVRSPSRIERAALDVRRRQRLVKIPNIGLVNVVAGRAVAPEFVQDALQPTAVADALEPLLDRGSPERRDDDRGARTRFGRRSGQPGAAGRVATWRWRSPSVGRPRWPLTRLASRRRARGATDRAVGARRRAGSCALSDATWRIRVRNDERRARAPGGQAADHLHRSGTASCSRCCIIIAVRESRC